MSKKLLEKYSKNGFVILKNAIPSTYIDLLMTNYLKFVNEFTGNDFDGVNSPDLINFFGSHRDVEAAVYNKIREKRWLVDFSSQPQIIERVKEILGEKVGIFRKIPFRIDLPFWTEELAYWHQDHFYVKGNTNIVVAWIPMQDTSYIHGCLTIMPKTHLLGSIKHDFVIGKKSVPSNIFDNEIKMVEMKRGDLLLFSTLLLHSSNLNISNIIRYAVQARFTRLNESVDEGMERVIPL